MAARRRVERERVQYKELAWMTAVLARPDHKFQSYDAWMDTARTDGTPTVDQMKEWIAMWHARHGGRLTTRAEREQQH